MEAVRDEVIQGPTLAQMRARLARSPDSHLKRALARQFRSEQATAWFGVGILLAAAVMFVVGGVLVPLATQVIADPALRLGVGIVVIVTLGALGLVLRGVGELLRPPRSGRWKSAGYFCGAVAYTATATVALVNGLPALLS